MLESLQSIISASGRGVPDRVAAYNASGSITWAEFVARTDAWQAPLDTIDESHVLLRQADNGELLVGLLAIWKRGGVAVFSGSDRQPDSRALDTMRQILKTGELSESNQETALILFTSGSTGTPTAIAKTFSQLDAELAQLESLWGAGVKESVFVSTVSRHHMYGLPFGLLWPVVRGSGFYTETIHYFRSLEALALRFPLTVITSPVQLDNLPHDLNFDALKPRLARVFSAGSPLPGKAAQRCRDLLIPVTEVYGSTETGAVAWRDQTDNPLWRRLPDIRISVTGAGQLQVKSPSLNPPGHWFSMADRVEVHRQHELEPQHFELLGRIDRVVKVGGKRISLTEVEACLSTHPWVTEVRTLPLEERKSRIGAVLALTAQGRAALIDRGRRVVNQLLAGHLGGKVEPVAIPRYWRYLSRLPVDAQGKVSTAVLSKLFFPDQQPRLPEILQRSAIGESELRLLLRIPESLFYFYGHFPGAPVLPGVVQIHWAQYFGESFLQGRYGFKRVEILKFQHIIQAGDIVSLTLAWQPSTAKLAFSYASEQWKHASGRLVYRNTAEADDG